MYSIDFNLIEFGFTSISNFFPHYTQHLYSQYLSGRISIFRICVKYARRVFFYKYQSCYQDLEVQGQGQGLALQNQRLALQGQGLAFQARP